MRWVHRSGMFFKQKVLSHQKSHGNGQDDKQNMVRDRQSICHSPVRLSARPMDGGLDNDDDGVIWCRHRNFQEVTNCQLKWLNLLCARSFSHFRDTFAWDVQCESEIIPSCLLSVLLPVSIATTTTTPTKVANNHFGVQIYTLIDGDPFKQHSWFSIYSIHSLFTLSQLFVYFYFD